MEMEITLKELGSFLEQGAQLIDVRDELSFSYGNIGGSVNIPLEQLKQSYEKYRDQKLVLYCKRARSVFLRQSFAAKGHRGLQPEGRVSGMADGSHE